MSLIFPYTDKHKRALCSLVIFHTNTVKCEHYLELQVFDGTA